MTDLTDSARRRLAGAAVAASALLAAACGQRASAHARIAASGNGFWDPAPVASALQSPNGENTGPASGAITYKFTVTTVTKKKHVGGGKETSNPLKACPVRGRGSFSDDFGAPRYSGGFHLHQGNDMFAALGTPIVAPFDGRAVQAPNKLGGLAVIVYGPQGYVYNAHLAAYGKLGEVKTGDVVGFVGNTGDAAGGPWHDHFEWHPLGVPSPLHMSPYGVSDLQGAVDPFPYLGAACG
jgi:murein DD-endopeptidase MepM/ murein hydrolase activator NlpD